MIQFKQIILILVIFFKTGNVLSENDLFSVDNIILEKKNNISSNKMANIAIKEAFIQLTKKVLLKQDIEKLSNLNYSNIKELVAYYNITKKGEMENNKVNFSVTFDKDKLHHLFFKGNISYSDINDKDFYILPILLREDEIFVFSNNFFYENWNQSESNELIEFILPLENIEIIQNINRSRNNLPNLDLNTLFKEYSDKNIGIALIQTKETESQKIYLKMRIEGKEISKNLNLEKIDFKKNNFNEKIIFKIKDEITNLIKSKNLIDVRTPSFINVKLDFSKENNLIILNSRASNIDVIENIFVQEMSKDHIYLKIKYLGKLDRLINQLRSKNITLKLVNDFWVIKNL